MIFCPQYQGVDAPPAECALAYAAFSSSYERAWESILNDEALPILRKLWNEEGRLHDSLTLAELYMSFRNARDWYRSLPYISLD